MKQDDISLIIPKNGIPDQAVEDDAGSLVSAREDEENFDTDDELPTVPLMSRSRTIEEVDFRATFGDEKKVTPDANLAPRRHNVLFALIFFILFVAAMVDQRGRIQPDQHMPCGYGSSQKRDMVEDELGQDGLPRKDLLNNCQNLAIWPESLQPSTTSTFPSYPTLNGEKKARSAIVYTNSSMTAIPTASASSMAPMAEPASDTTCSTEGELMCHGPDYFGICSHGTIMWRHVAKGTQCREGEVAGTNIPPILPSSYGNGLGSATAWGPPETSATSTTVMSSDHGTTFQTMVYPTVNASVYDNDTEDGAVERVHVGGWDAHCKARGNAKVGEPDLCFCYNEAINGADANIRHAINHACQYFEHNSLGPAPYEDRNYKQVFASNYMVKDGGKLSRILIKMEYWGDANGNDVRQGGPCIIFRRSWAQCVKAFSSLEDLCGHYVNPVRKPYNGGYGMDSCAMWTVDLNPAKNNKGIPEQIDGNHNFFLMDDPARNSKSKVSSATVTWPRVTYPIVPISIPGRPTSTTST